jgi:hypothetical protein
MFQKVPTEERFEVRLRVNAEQRKYLEQKAAKLGDVSLCDVVRWLIQQQLNDAEKAA